MLWVDYTISMFGMSAQFPEFAMAALADILQVSESS